MIRLLYIKSLALLFLFLPVTLLAQSTITGKVLSLLNKKPIPDATVFLSNTTTGTKTLEDGAFKLRNVKNGQYDLVISCIGYETYHQDIRVYNADIKLDDIELMPKVTSLKEISIKASQGKIKHQDLYLRIFTDEFFGSGPNASACKILNPKVLDFSYDEASDKLTATSSGFLVIENKALGYRIKYLLESFLKDPRNLIMHYIGSCVFEEMTGTAEQQKEWENKRVKAYLGSEMHFLRCCIADVVSYNDFTVFNLDRVRTQERPSDSLITMKLKFFNGQPTSDSLRYWKEKSKLPRYSDQLAGPEPLKEIQYIKLTPEKGIYAIGDTACLMINYKHHVNGSNAYTSMLNFKQRFAFFDSNGIIINPLSNIIEGYWGYHRMADLLPYNYELPATK